MTDADAEAYAPPNTADPYVPQPMLRGEKIWLRSIEPSELVEGVEQVNDAEIAHFAGFKTPLTRAGAERFSQKLVKQPGQAPSWMIFNIVPLGEKKGIGTVGFRDIDHLNGSAELTILLDDRRLLGKGFGTDAVNAVCDFGFGELRLERIMLRVFDYNARAIRSYEKAGFQTDALTRKSRFHRGVHHDVLVMSIIRDDWLALPRPKSWDLAGP
jgi:RimJ/RimL family protein N-acetyltransferase